MKKKSKKSRRPDAPYAKRRSKSVPLGKNKANRTARKRIPADSLHHGDTLKGESFTGNFRASGKGYGFIIPANGGDDFFVPPPYVGGAMNGDTVEAKLLCEGDGRGRGSEAAVVSITERARDYVIGTLCTDGHYVWIECDDRSANAEVTSFTVYAVPGDKVELKILKYPDEYRERTVGGRNRRNRNNRVILTLSGEVTENYGQSESREANYMSILRECSIPTEFPADVISEAKERSTAPVTADGRVDMRDRVIFTIDGEGAKDLDDAISIERTENGYILGVHIADVSHYVTTNSALDREAIKRGTSVYFIDRVVPMLPKELSNGACSLNAGEDKLALSAFIRINGDGDIVGYEFKKSLIRSAVRGVYSEVNDLLEKGDRSEFAEKYAEVRVSLGVLHELYVILYNKAKSRGVLELETTEAQIVMGDDGLPADVVPRVRGKGERMIEQFMLCANIAAASFMEGMDMPGVYRVHQSPDPEKMRTLILFAHNAGLDVSSLGSVSHSEKGDDPSVELNGYPGTNELCEILHEAEEKGIGEIVSTVMLRSMMKAKYQGSPAPHFGLGVPLYSHFTSPIRRYPDLFIHRVISAHLAGKRPPSHERAQNAAILSSQREIAAQTAERQIEALYLTLWMEQHLGEVFDAQVSGVCSSGIFVRTDMLCEGLVPEESLGRIIEYNENTLTLRVQTRDGEIKYSLGDRIRVAARETDVIARKITFELV